jgi:hypothetical protein
MALGARKPPAKPAKGTSEDRQLEIAPRIAAEKGWQLDESLNLLDLGLSAYKKQNVGSLKAVCAAAEADRIPAGSVRKAVWLTTT